MDIVTVRQLKKYYREGTHVVKALDGLDLTVQSGKFTAVIGNSGSGKTTLLHVIGGLCKPTEGEVLVGGMPLSALTQEELTVFRRRRIGFVFQGESLVPELTVRENILLPLAMDDTRPDERFLRELLSFLGLEEKENAFPAALSGGQKQRTAVARALITRPDILLADEPTGSLDVKNAQNVAQLLKLSVDCFHQTLLFVTHNRQIAQLADDVICLRDGRVCPGGDAY